jgi:hypothetical protein
MNLPSNWPKTLVMLTVSLFTAILVRAADQDRPAGDGMFIATTGRIVTIDLQTKMLRVRGSDSEPARNFIRPKRRFSSPVITLPGRLGIHIPVRVERNPNPSKTAAGVPNLDKYTVVITSKTLIQDGAEDIRLEDFAAGETISIHGILKGNTLTASRISKWS